MGMNREQKATVVTELKEKFSSANGAFLVNYRGLTVSDLRELRGKLREHDSEFKVSKARLMKRAVGDLEGIDQLIDDLHGQIGLVFSFGETPTTAKDIINFAKDNEKLEVVAGYFESRYLPKDKVVALSKIPPREELMAQLAGVLAAPISQLTRVLSSPAMKLAHSLKEVAKQKDGGADSSAS